MKNPRNLPYPQQVSQRQNPFPQYNTEHNPKNPNYYSYRSSGSPVQPKLESKEVLLGVENRNHQQVPPPPRLEEERTLESSHRILKSVSPTRIPKTLPLQEESTPRHSAQNYLSNPMLPVPEEEYGEGFQESPYQLEFDKYENQTRPEHLIQQQPRVALPLDNSPANNYQPFRSGTYFGPSILNKYRGDGDFFTPQANQLRSVHLNAVNGDMSSKSSKLQNHGPQTLNSIGPQTTGFSSMVDNAIKGYTQRHQRKGDDS